MKVTANHQAKILLQSITNRLEKTPSEFVEALFDLLAAPERKRSDRLLQDLLIQVWLLLECSETFAKSMKSVDEAQVFSQSTTLAPYDRLIQVVSDLIEAEIVRNWLPSREGNTFLSSKTSQLFWGGMTLHIKLALPQEPRSGSALFSNGVVTLSNGRSFPSEPPLSESQIYELITQLGHSFVSEYATVYIRHKELRRAIAAHSPKEKKNNDAVDTASPAPFELFVQERTLNRYVNKVANRIGAQLLDSCMRLVENPGEHILTLLESSSSLDSAVAQIITKATSALFVEQPKVESPISPLATSFDASGSSDLTAPSRTTRGLSCIEILEDFKRFQHKALTDPPHSIYIAQDLFYRELPGPDSRSITISDLLRFMNQHLLLAAPSGGGKTRLQQEILLCAHDSDTFHLWIDLTRFSLSRFLSFHRFAASHVLYLLSRDRGNLVKLEADLMTLDLDGKIYWHLDSWDELPKADRTSVALAIAPLSQFTLATSNSLSAIQVFGTNGLSLRGVITIEAFAQARVLEFIEANFPNQSTRPNIKRRALQLSGLACLPRGVEHLCAYPEHQTVVDALLSYINSNLERVGEPLINPDDFIFDGLKENAWESDALASTYLLVKAMCARAQRTSKGYFHIAIDEVLPYMGAGNRGENHQLVLQRMEQAVRGKFLQENADGNSSSFIVPEIGFLLAALATVSQYPRLRRLDSALKEFQKDPYDPIHQMLLALGTWQHEKLLLRQISNLFSVGTVVPTRIETLSRISTSTVTPSNF